MSAAKSTVIGIDAGGERKGFHAVALAGGTFAATLASSDPVVIVSWCRHMKAAVVAVDAPCGWSAGGASRLAERSLAIGDKQITCFATPTRTRNQKQLLQMGFQWRAPLSSVGKTLCAFRWLAAGGAGLLRDLPARGGVRTGGLTAARRAA